MRDRINHWLDSDLVGIPATLYTFGVLAASLAVFAATIRGLEGHGVKAAGHVSVTEPLQATIDGLEPAQDSRRRRDHARRRGRAAGAVPSCGRCKRVDRQD
ncbi:MAG: hypothetical protein JST08_06475 [Actinobacteria bacterium]|nr:hypothetical protein [Actinomycetota bacterium]